MPPYMLRAFGMRLWQLPEVGTSSNHAWMTMRAWRSWPRRSGAGMKALACPTYECEDAGEEPSGHA